MKLFFCPYYSDYVNINNKGGKSRLYYIYP